jgi:hypothetical protein
VLQLWPPNFREGRLSWREWRFHGCQELGWGDRRPREGKGRAWTYDSQMPLVQKLFGFSGIRLGSSEDVSRLYFCRINNLIFTILSIVWLLDTKLKNNE